MLLSPLTQNPVLVLVLPAAMYSPEADSTVNLAPDRLNVPFHLSLSDTLVGRSNPIVYLETFVDVLFLTTKVPHPPSFHFES